MDRPAIPAEILRAVLVEAGHRCAIPTCKYPTTEIHHIVPWEKCESHDFDNLIALCPNCHNRADSGEIDRKALRLYKSHLSAAIGTDIEKTKIVDDQVKTISEVQTGRPGYEFEFEYPVFSEATLEPVSCALKSWGNDLLHRYRSSHTLDEPYEPELLGGPNTTSASFEVIRNDSLALSIKYRVIYYGSGAAHSNGYSVTKTFMKNPLFLVPLKQFFSPEADHLAILSQLSREYFLADGNRDEQWVIRGTEPEERKFKAFNVTDSGLLLTFDEYQVDCYAAGPQVIEIPASRLEAALNRRLPRLWKQTVF
jgi:hypothetical protein